MSERRHIATIGDATLVLVLDGEQALLEGWSGGEMRYSEPLSTLVKAAATHAQQHRHAERLATWPIGRWHAFQLHPDWEYICIETGRKDGQDGRPDGDGWEPNNYVVGGDLANHVLDQNWERFDYTENHYWMRPKVRP